MIPKIQKDVLKWATEESENIPALEHLQVGIDGYIHLTVPCGRHHSLTIELIPAAGEVATSKLWHSIRMNECGYLYMFCRTFDEVKEVVENYLIRFPARSKPSLILI
jgi:hypothetical protein